MKLSTIDRLQDELNNYGISANQTQIEQLLSYLTILNKWNETHNLTRISKGDQLNWHLLDAASVVKYCSGERILDVGSGCGIPGIPLSILLPNKKFVLIDNQNKKCIFLRYVINALGLDNVECIHLSVQNYQTAEKFNTILSRGFAQLTKFIQLCKHLLAEEGIFLAMKGELVEQEESCLPEGYVLQEKASLRVPGLRERFAIIVSKGQS